MKKILIAILLFLLCIGTNQKVFAASGYSVISITGSSYITNGPELSGDKYVWQTRGLSDMSYKQYSDSGFSKQIASGSNSGSSTGFAVGCNAYWIVSGNGGDFVMKIHVTGLGSNCEGYPDKTPPTDNGGGTGGGGSSTTCDTCGVFECPKWNEYMGQLKNIENAIPPAPNWDKVATTFQEKITPKIKEDMADLIGTTKTPTLPALPKAPEPQSDPAQLKPPKKNIFEVLDGVDERNPKKPTMKDTPDGGFDENDIKDTELPKENKDESGGFEINNPLEGLPEGSDFTKPKQDTIKTPIPKDESVNAPIPKDESVNTPIPKDETVNTPIPKDESVNTPIPKDDDLKQPSTDGELKLPIPKE